jgi:hypothetical protein
VGYSLICTGKKEWDVPTGTFGKRKAFQSIQIYEPSIKSDTTCVFMMYDSGGDGLMAAGGYRAGSLYVTMTVAHYVASSSNSFHFP